MGNLTQKQSLFTMPGHKAAILGLGAAAALTGAALMYKHPKGQQLFASDTLGEEEYRFMRYVSEYGKSYGTVAEFMFRKEQFTTRHNEIEAFNADANNTHTVGHNHFSDRTYAEMKKLNGYVHQEAKNVVELPETTSATVDWRSHDAVTPVKNQGQCGSCWAFSTTGAVEGADAIKSGSLKSFSEQQLVSCSKQNSGCNGGLMDYAFQYLQSAGAALESSYPYTSGQGRVSSCKSFSAVGSVSGFSDVRVGSKSQFKAAVAQQPVSVAIEPIKWPSKLTPVVLSPPDVEPNLTTVSSPSDTEPWTELSTLSSRTPGVHLGVMRDTSESPLTTTLAVSSTLLPTHTLECNIHQIVLELS